MELLLSLGVGLVVGYYSVLPKKWNWVVQHVFTASFIVLLIGMGAKVGSDQHVLDNLFSIGWRALVFSCLSIGGSVILVWYVERWFKRETVDDIMEEEWECPQSNGSIVFTQVVPSLIFGVVLGRWLLPENTIVAVNLVTVISLNIMILGAGIDMGNNKKVWFLLRTMGAVILLIPCTIITGAMLGGVVGSILLRLPVFFSLAAGAASGFYSFIGPLVTDKAGAELGALAFLSNLLREVLSLLFIPTLAKKFGGMAAIASGGATTMDSTLPVIFRALGPQVAMVGMLSGAVLTVIIPVVIPLLLYF